MILTFAVKKKKAETIKHSFYLSPASLGIPDGQIFVSNVILFLILFLKFVLL